MATTSAVIKINLEIEGGKTLALNIGNLKELKSAIKTINETRITLDPRSPKFGEASNQLKQLQGLYKGLSKDADTATVQIDQFNKELNEPPKAVGYYRQLSAQLAVLKNQYKDLSEADAKSKVGKNLAAQINGVNNKLKEQDASLGTFSRNVGNYKQSFAGITNLLPLLGVGLGAGEIINATREFEKLFAILKQVTGNEASANKVFSDIQQFAKETPFQINELVGAFVKLENRNFNPTIEQLRVIGDIAASSGKTVDQFTEAILDAATGEFERLKEFGIVARKNGDDLRVSFRGQSETFKNTTENITAYLLKIGQLPGIQGSAVAVSKTLDGSISNLQDNFVALAANIGGTDGALKSFVDFVNSAVEAINEFVGTPLSDKLQQQKSDFNALIGVLQDTTTAESERNAVIQTLKTEYPGYLQFVNEDVSGQIDLAKTIEFGNSLFEKRILLQATEEQRTKLVRERIKLEQQLTTALSDQQKAASVGVRTRTSARNEASDLGGTENIQAKSERDVLFIRENIKKVSDDLSNLTKTADDTALRTTGKTLSELSNEINNLDKKEKKVSDSIGFGSKIKNESTGAADSISTLTNRVTQLQDALSKAPQSGIVSATQKLVLAEQALARAKAKEQEARNPTQNLTEFQQAEAGLVSLGVDVNTPQNEADAKAQLDALALELSGAAGVTIPVELDQDQVRKDFEIQKYFLDQEDKARAENAEKERQRKEDQQRQNQEFLDIGLQAATQFNSQLAAQESARVDANLQKQTDAINTEFDEKRAAAQGNAVIIANLDKQQQAAQLAAEKEAARQRKNIALKEAVIAYALAAIKAGANVAGQIAAAAAFALGLAAINAQQFFAGGTVKDMTNESGVVKSANMKPTKHGDNRVAFLKVGERVLTKDNQAAIEQQYGSGIWRNIGAKDPGSIFGARHGSMVNPSYGFGRPILNVNTSLSREDIGLLARANAITSERIAESVKVGMAEGAKYNARQEKALSKTR
jgi:hypothetical protein